MKKAYPPGPPIWHEVVFSADCDEDGTCPKCGEDFAECPHIGPTQEGFVYAVRYGKLMAREETPWD